MARRRKAVEEKQARIEFLAWIDSTPIPFDWEEIKSESGETEYKFDSQIDEYRFIVIVELIKQGRVSITEDGKLIQKLDVPIEIHGKNDDISELVYQPRITANKVINALDSVKKDKEEERKLAVVSARTDCAVLHLKKMDSNDLIIANTICETLFPV